MANKIIGAGGFAREVAAMIGGKCEFYVTREYMAGDTRHISGLYGFRNYGRCILAIGAPKIRESFAYNHLLRTVISKRANVRKGNKIGKGSIICDGATLTTNIKLGTCVIVNINATIGHDTKVGRFTTISPGANISGNVTIGQRCYIGSGASIREGITICDDVTIGMGAVVVKDITEPGTYVGVPAKKL